MIEKALIHILHNDADVVASIAKKVRPVVIGPQDDLPYADYSLISDREEKHSEGTVGVQHAMLEITSYAADPIVARIIDQKIRDALVGTPDGITPVKAMARGVIGSTGVDVRSWWSEDAQTEPDLGSRGQSKGPYAVRRLYQVTYKRIA